MILILRNHLHWQEIISNLLLTLLIVASVSFKTIQAQQQVANIGDISELKGNAQIVREEPLDAFVDFDIQSNDEAITSNGRMAITFLDDSIVKLTEHSQLLINEYIYDPNPAKSKMALTFALGTTRFNSGNVNKLNKQNISLRTPTANILIRGTDFTATVIGAALTSISSNLKKGYSILMDKKKIVKTSKKITTDDQLSVKLIDGTIDIKVTKIN